MAEEEYELLPHKILEDLKYEVESLKQKLLKPDAKANELILEIESLKDSTQELHSIFQKALEQSKGEEDFSTLFKTIKERLDTVVSQNETIAKGMIAVSDKVDEFVGKSAATPSFPSSPVQFPAGAPAFAPQAFSPPELSRHTMGMPTMPGARMAPLPEGDFPPPPPLPPRKRGGIFK